MNSRATEESVLKYQVFVTVYQFSCLCITYVEQQLDKYHLYCILLLTVSSSELNKKKCMFEDMGFYLPLDCDCTSDCIVFDQLP